MNFGESETQKNDEIKLIEKKWFYQLKPGRIHCFARSIILLKYSRRNIPLHFLFYETLSRNKLSDVKNATHFLIEGPHSFDLSSLPPHKI